MAQERSRTSKGRERGAGERRSHERFPEGRGDAGKRGDPPIEEPKGERSRHGHPAERPEEEDP